MENTIQLPGLYDLRPQTLPLFNMDNAQANMIWLFGNPGQFRVSLVLELIESRQSRQRDNSVYSTRPFCRVVQRPIRHVTRYG